MPAKKFVTRLLEADDFIEWSSLARAYCTRFGYTFRTFDERGDLSGFIRVDEDGSGVMAVRPDLRRKGIGTALLKATDQGMQAAGRTPDFTKSIYTAEGKACVEAYCKAQGISLDFEPCDPNERR